MVTEEHPKQHRPWHDRGEKALDGAIAAALAGPAGDTQHGDPSRHHQHGPRNPAQLAPGRRGHTGLQAVDECSNGHWGLLRRGRVEVVVDYHSNATTEALSSKGILAKVLIVYYPIFLILLSLIVSRCSGGDEDGSNGGQSGGGEATQNLVTLRGSVDDGLGTSPIANAECRFLDLNGSQLATATADRNGDFRVEAPLNILERFP